MPPKTYNDPSPTTVAKKPAAAAPKKYIARKDGTDTYSCDYSFYGTLKEISKELQDQDENIKEYYFFEVAQQVEVKIEMTVSPV